MLASFVSTNVKNLFFRNDITQKPIQFTNPKNVLKIKTYLCNKKMLMTVSDFGVNSFSF